MTDAPAKIWRQNGLHGQIAYAAMHKSLITDNETPYIRADIHEALQARVAELEEALKPFAEEAIKWNEFDASEPLVEGWHGGVDSHLTVYHLVAAYRTLTPPMEDKP